MIMANDVDYHVTENNLNDANDVTDSEPKLIRSVSSRREMYQIPHLPTYSPVNFRNISSGFVCAILSYNFDRQMAP